MCKVVEGKPEALGTPAALATLTDLTGAAVQGPKAPVPVAESWWPLALGQRAPGSAPSWPRAVAAQHTVYLPSPRPTFQDSFSFTLRILFFTGNNRKPPGREPKHRASRRCSRSPWEEAPTSPSSGLTGQESVPRPRGVAASLPCD